MSKFIVLVLLAALISAVSCSFWGSCVGVRAPRSIESTACASGICEVYRGETASFVFSSRFMRPHHNLWIRLTEVNHATKIGRNIKMSPPNNDACNSITPGRCPVVTSRDYEYTIMYTPDNHTPLGRDFIYVEIIEFGVIICASIPIVVKEKP